MRWVAGPPRAAPVDPEQIAPRGAGWHADEVEVLPVGDKPLVVGTESRVSGDEPVLADGPGLVCGSGRTEVLDALLRIRARDAGRRDRDGCREKEAVEGEAIRARPPRQVVPTPGPETSRQRQQAVIAGR